MCQHKERAVLGELVRDAATNEKFCEDVYHVLRQRLLDEQGQLKVKQSRSVVCLVHIVLLASIFYNCSCFGIFQDVKFQYMRQFETLGAVIAAVQQEGDYANPHNDLHMLTEQTVSAAVLEEQMVSHIVSRVLSLSSFTWYLQ